MFGVDVSVATLNNWLTQAAATLDVFLASVRAGLAEAPVVHVDETPVRHGKRKAWFHVCSTRSLTLLWASATRSRIAVDTGPARLHRHCSPRPLRPLLPIPVRSRVV